MKNKLNFNFLDCSGATQMKMYEDADFYKGDLKKITDVSTLEDCVKLCVADADCEYFTYVPNKKKCWLKDGISIEHCQYIITNIIKIYTYFYL